MTPSRLSPHYHVGIVVADVVSAQRTLTEQLGVAWGPILHLDTNEFRDGEGRDLILPNTLCYSVDDPHLELIQEVPGSVWVRNEHSNLHHIGFWSDDFPSESERLRRAGCPLQLCGRSGQMAPNQFAYHGHELGIRIEIVDAALRPTIESFLFRPPAS